MKLAIENQRWDLAAHVVVLATLQVKENGEQDAQKKTGSAKGQPERP